MKILSQILKAAGYICLTIALLPIIVGLMSAGITGLGIPEIIVTAIIILPGIGFLVWARWLKNHKTN